MKYFNARDFSIVRDGTFLIVPKINQLTKEQAQEFLDIVLFWVENDSLPEYLDPELEEAKMKYKLGSYFKTRHSNDILMVKEVYRGLDDGTIIIVSKCGSCNLNDCAPFPLPVWRCCKGDKPKKTGAYVLRRKGNSLIMTNSTYYADNDVWSIVNGSLHGWDKWKTEWLDEGEL